MQCRVRQRVHWVQCCKSQPVELALLPAGPEFIQTFWSEALGSLIPQPKVQLHCQRHIDVEEIAAPLPVSFPDHDRQMINGVAFESGDRLVAETGREVSRPQHLVFGEQQIKVALPTVSRIIDEERTMAEALENSELETLGFELGCNLLECDLG